MYELCKPTIGCQALLRFTQFGGDFSTGLGGLLCGFSGQYKIWNKVLILCVVVGPTYKMVTQ